MNNISEYIFEVKFSIAYLFMVLIVIFILFELGFKYKFTCELQKIFLFCFAGFYIFLFGLRGLNVGIDTERTASFFLENSNLNIFNVKDIGILIISKFLFLFSDDVNVFLIILSSLYIFPIYLGILKLKTPNPFFFFFIFVSFFFFKSMGINTARQGIAFSLFFLGLIYFYKGFTKKMFLLYIFSFIMHASIVIPIAIFFISFKIKKLYIPLIIFIAASILSFFNFDFASLLSKVPIVNILVADRLDTYLNVTSQAASNYKTGFRLDFYLFNCIFAVLGFLTLKKLNPESCAFYKHIYICYLLLSAFFFLMFSVPFSDRFGFLSWIFIPLIFLPYLNSKFKVGYINLNSIAISCVVIFIYFNLIK